MNCEARLRPWEIAIKVRIGKLEWPVHTGSVNAYALDELA
jgi:hypothetical protein